EQAALLSETRTTKDHECHLITMPPNIQTRLVNSGARRYRIRLSITPPAGGQDQGFVVRTLQLGAQLEAAFEGGIFKWSVGARVGMMLQCVAPFDLDGDGSRQKSAADFCSRLLKTNPMQGSKEQLKHWVAGLLLLLTRECFVKLIDG